MARSLDALDKPVLSPRIRGRATLRGLGYRDPTHSRTPAVWGMFVSPWIGGPDGAQRVGSAPVPRSEATQSLRAERGLPICSFGRFQGTLDSPTLNRSGGSGRFRS